MERKLSALSPGETAVVKNIRPGTLSDRLLDLGFTPGASVTCLRKAPLGDPAAYEIRGAVICLRHVDAGAVLVESPRVDEVASWQ